MDPSRREQSINVVVRLRPLNAKEQADGARPLPTFFAPLCGSAFRASRALRARGFSHVARRGAGTLPVVTSSTQNREVTIIRGTGKAQVRSTFKYDGVFGSYATQAEVFQGVLAGDQSVLGDVMKGFESTVFAYGQTGTGKTHTMEGDLTNSDAMGVRRPRRAPRAPVAALLLAHAACARRSSRAPR